MISRLTIFVLLVVISTQLQGQKDSLFYSEDGFGFNLGSTNGFLQIEYDSLPQTSRIWSRNGAGLNLGIIYYKQLDRRIRFRPEINLVLMNNQLIYEDETGVIIEKNLFPAFIEIPIQFIFTNKDFGQNISFLFGVKLSKSLNSGNSRELIIRDSFTSATFALGKEFNTGRFRISPEVSYSFGLENLYRFSTISYFQDSMKSIQINELAIRFYFY